MLAVKGDVLRRVLTEEGSRLDGQRQLLALIENGEAAAFAQQVIERERLPAEEKMRIKKERVEHHRREYMKAQPPTEPQLSFLRSLGCKTTPANRFQAS